MPLHPASSLQTPLAEGSLYRAVEEERVSASWVKSKQQHENAQHLHGVLQELLHLCNYSGGLKGIDGVAAPQVAFLLPGQHRGRRRPGGLGRVCHFHSSSQS